MHGYHRPLLVLPANLIGKTQRERKEYERDWHLPRKRIEIISYERLSRVSCKDYLESMLPDIIVCDEGHRLKNVKTGIHRRMRRYVNAHRPVFVILSGTLIGERFMQWAPSADWALNELSPAPRKWTTQSSWAGALDIEGRTSPGALRVFIRDLNADADYSSRVRAGYGERVRDSLGVICKGGDECGASIELYPIALPHSDALEAALDVAAQWELPDGSVMVDPLSASRAARQLELGCYYRWIVPAPPDWLDARKNIGAVIRDIIKHRQIDTGLEARNWIDRNGDADSRAALSLWRDIEPKFTPVTECVWVEDAPIKALVEHALTAPCIIWVWHKEIGYALERAGIPYYGAGGLREGVSIEAETGTRSVCASIESNATGRNLQMFSRAIIAETPDDPKKWEQLIGRMHRTGQRADEVTVQPVLSTKRARVAFERTRERARAIEAVTAITPKLLLAVELNDEVDE
jgi:hypothetical protein